MIEPRKYGSIAFSPGLAAQDFETKQVALKELSFYFNEAHLGSVAERFWESVQAFQIETNGLNEFSRDEIVRVDLPKSYRDDIQRLGFEVSPISGGTCDF